MSDYVLQATWSTKDALAHEAVLKAISATELGTEFEAIASAVATKFDTQVAGSGGIATTAQAQGGTNNNAIMTSLRVREWADYDTGAKLGLVGELHDIADPGADRIFFWDDGASAGSNLAFLAVRTGLTLSGTNLTTDDSAIVHDSLSGFVANEHIDHTAVTLTAGNGLTGGGTIAANRSFAVGAGTGITVNADNVALTDISSSTTQPISLTSGALDFDITALTNIEGNALAATDEFIVDDGGVNKALDDANTIMEFSGTATLTIPTDGTPIPEGAAIIICNAHASQQVTVSVGASVTLNSVHHPGGAVSETDVVLAGGTAALIKVAANEWYLSGDVGD
jgi:hypothetical protein